MDRRSQEGFFQDSELNPRRFQPVGHGAAAVPKIQPEVPDVSIFFPSYRALNSGGKNEADSIMSSVRNLVQPTQAKPPTIDNWKPNSELSRMFQQLSHEEGSIMGNQQSRDVGFGFSRTLNQEIQRLHSDAKDCPPGSTRSTPGTARLDLEPIGPRTQSLHSPLDKPETTPKGSQNLSGPRLTQSDWPPTSDVPPSIVRSSHIPADVYDLLIWQQNQILLLQQQVRILIAGSKVEASNSSESKIEPKNSEKESDSNVEVEKSRLELSLAERNEMKSGDSNRSSVLLTATQQSPQRQVEEEKPSQDRHCGFDALSRISFNDLVHSNPFGIDFNIDSERDVRPPKNIDDLMSQNSQVSIPEDQRAPKVPADENSFTMSRLREMGVSFLNKEDLMPKFKSDGKNEKDTTMFWYPRVVETQGPSMATSTSEYSMMLNSAVLKYLKDDQLAKVATNSSNNSSRVPTLQSLAPDADLTRFGVSESLLTDSTQQFLRENHLDFH